MKMSRIWFSVIGVGLLFVIIISCGEDDPVSSFQNVNSFEVVLEAGGNSYFDCVAEGEAGTILAGGRLQVPWIDTTVTPPDTFGIGQALLAKFDRNGDTLWTRLLNNSDVNEQVSKVVKGVSGGYLAVSVFSSGRFSSALRFQGIHEDGELSWSQVVTVGQFSHINDIIISADGNYILAGNSTSMGPTGGAYIAKMSPAGAILWDTLHFITDTAIASEGVIEMEDGTIVVGGIARDRTTGNRTPFIMKVDPDGTSLSVKFVSGIDSYYVYDIAESDSGRVRLIGAISSVDADSYFVMTVDSLGRALGARYQFPNGDVYWYDGSFNSDGSALFTGIDHNDPGEDFGFYCRLRNDGEYGWERVVDHSPEAGVSLRAGVEYSGGGYLFCGFHGDQYGDGSDLLLIKTDEHGLIESD